MSTSHSMPGIVLLIALFMCLSTAGLIHAEEKSYYSPIIFVDKEKGYFIISNSGSVFGIEVPSEAKSHLEQLPVGGLIDVVVELRPDKAPLVKRWKLASGESSCKIFDGKTCK